MTERELCKYLGVPEGTALSPQIVEGMKGVPFPATDEGHIEAFRAYLRCAGQPRATVRATSEH